MREKQKEQERGQRKAVSIVLILSPLGRGVGILFFLDKRGK